MKRFLLRLSIALLTFLLGLGITSVFIFFTHIPNIEVIDLIETKNNNGIEIQYKWTLIDKKDSTGIFKVTNNSYESLYYLAYDKNQHVDNWIRQNGEVKMATFFICHMGMEEQELKPNETAFFEITVPRNRKPFEAGFDFFIGDKQQPKTFWIKVDKQLKYSAVKTKY